jgi:hypothetical protein
MIRSPFSRAVLLSLLLISAVYMLHGLSFITVAGTSSCNAVHRSTTRPQRSCFHHLSISAARKHVERDLHFAPITLPDTLQHLALLHPSSTRHTDAVSIIDALVIPTDISPGPYVLGFRYDCEATAQVWSSCADIEIA